MLFFVLIVILGTLLYYYVVWLQNYWKRRGVPQGRTIWLFGDLFWYTLRRESTADLVKRVYDECPGTRYSGLYQFTSPTLIIKDVDLIKLLAIKDFDHFPDHRIYIPEEVDPLWGKNLFAVQGRKWRQMRPVLSPMFTGSKMKMMFNLIAECAENFVDYFHQYDSEIVEFESKDIFSRYSNDVIGTCIFGNKVDAIHDKKNEFFQKGCELTDFTNFWKNFSLFGYIVFPRFCKWLNLKVVSDEERNYYCELLNQTMNMRKKQGIIRLDMVHLLMEARDNQKLDSNDPNSWRFTDEDIAAQAVVFHFAGFDNATIFCSYVSYELAVNPEIQDRLYEEVRQINEDLEGEITYEALQQMNYLDMVVSETLRKWPINVETDRICTKPYVIEPTSSQKKPVNIEVNTIIWFPIYAIHHDPKYYPDPERFDPERFNESNKHNIKHGSYLPFGIGPRNCVASRFALMEIKILFVYLLLNFEIVPVKKTNIPIQLSKSTFNMKPDPNLWLGLKRRQK